MYWCICSSGGGHVTRSHTLTHSHTRTCIAKYNIINLKRFKMFFELSVASANVEFYLSIVVSTLVVVVAVVNQRCCHSTLKGM